MNLIFLGKGGVNVIIVDGDYERSSSSVEDESIPMITNPTLLSPITTNEVKNKSAELVTNTVTMPVHPNIKPVTPSKTEPPTTETLNTVMQSLWVRIQLNRLNLNCIPALKKKIEVTRPWLLETKVTPKLSPKISAKPEETVKKEDKPSNVDCKPKIPKEIKTEVLKETKSEVAKELRGELVKETKNELKKTPLTDELHRDRKHKSKKRKRRNSSSSISSHSTISNLSQSSKHNKHLIKELEDSKSKRRKEDSESRSQTENLNLTTTPPTNHERETNKTQTSKSSTHTSPASKPRSCRQYRSYFEPPDEPPDLKKR